MSDASRAGIGSNREQPLVDDVAFGAGARRGWDSGPEHDPEDDRPQATRRSTPGGGYVRVHGPIGPIRPQAPWRSKKRPKWADSVGRFCGSERWNRPRESAQRHAGRCARGVHGEWWADWAYRQRGARQPARNFDAGAEE